ncbi:hypothetical protein H257_17067 [Aphanomyces astaci]|uniref:Crinkler effector protein N-terminal domain-containing protein n=1 Tax=Aphanomyces astaci TaxID=112090 RepID=W4FI48_APHAT|nr:hypothetical protein H257_17067 [Aphanomyces astaci]ETV66496.1 hypothetical protein H257_17067 [Aphanomyces astaci]|eukprot:XP_009844025.1 hypothetical protein H257_17067 [Aphanomyces astaci]
MFAVLCVVVGEDGPFPVNTAAPATVGGLNQLIKTDNHRTITCDAKDLQLCRVEGLMQDDDETPGHETSILGCFKAAATSLIWFNTANVAPTGKIHILVVNGL